jgi:hypothetical protein
MKSAFVRGLLAVIIGTLAAIYGTENASVVFYAVSVFGAVLVYFAQNALIKPITVFGTIDLRDILKGAIMAVGTAASTYAASLLLDISFTWQSFGDTLWIAFAAYLSKNLFSNSEGAIGLEKK